VNANTRSMGMSFFTHAKYGIYVKLLWCAVRFGYANDVTRSKFLNA
jgi:hypothetical protein